ncbi:MAG TPA: methyltransferase domain-containing protein [Anaerolineae bacterium]|nr:methyltransferase domain-containing protein [Anaerolineae bacterium]
MTWVILIACGLVLAATIYWLLIISEGVYLGSRVVIALYDRSAQQYDDIKGVLPLQDAVHLARPLVDALKKRAPADVSEAQGAVLDVATGTARLPAALFRQFDFGGRVVGVDLSSGMLRVAQERLERHRDRAAWVLDPATCLPFADGSFAAVTCIEALELLPDARRSLQEMVRVLEPGGCLMITNRVGVDRYFYPGHAFPRHALEAMLRELGLEEVTTRRWQTHYDLIDARKRADGSC